MKIITTVMLTLIMISAFGIASAETGKISGYVYCGESKKPLSSVTVTLILPGEYNLYAITDENGYFEFSDVAAGTYSLFASSLTHVEMMETVTVGTTGPAAGTDTDSSNFNLEVDYMTMYCDG